MERFSTLEGMACPLGLANVDTDQLIPARFMKRSRSDGYGGFLLHDLRFNAQGLPLKDFILNQPAYTAAKIIIARHNFGTGSSREAAVYALWDYGIRCVIAPSFGDIFAANAVKNGLLPAQVSEADAALLLSETGPFSIDLAAQSITTRQGRIGFSIDPVRRLQLLNGWDDLDLTLRHTDAISAFRAVRSIAKPWVWPQHR